jgi:nicotinamide-nucleotide amidase
MKRDAQRLAGLLQARGSMVAVAESLTAGLLQAEIASVSGASRHFAGGLTAYSVDQKVGLLGVDRAHAEAVDCVSEAVARQMAAGVAARFGVGVAAATTGYAEPWGEVTEPFAHFAVWCDGGIVRAGRVAAPGCARRAAQLVVVAAVMEALVDALLELDLP